LGAFSANHFFFLVSDDCSLLGSSLAFSMNDSLCLRASCPHAATLSHPSGLSASVMWISPQANAIRLPLLYRLPFRLAAAVSRSSLSFLRPSAITPRFQLTSGRDFEWGNFIFRLFLVGSNRPLTSLHQTRSREFFFFFLLFFFVTPNRPPLRSS